MGYFMPELRRSFYKTLPLEESGNIMKFTEENCEKTKIHNGVFGRCDSFVSYDAPGLRGSE
jgi:hypothetical protein